MEDTSIKEAYYNAIDMYNKSEIKKARNLFEISKDNPEFEINTIIKLIIIDIQEGKYDIARKRLETFYNKENKNNDEFNRLYSLLEIIEYNFEESKKYAKKRIEISGSKDSIMSLAKIYAQLGNYDLSKNIFESLIYGNDIYSYQAQMELIYIHIIKKEYEEAYAILKNIKNDRLPISIKNNYENIKLYILYKLGVIKNFNEINNYYIYQLVNNDENYLLEHIKKHKKQSNKAEHGYFYNNINLIDLLKEVKEKIKNMPPNHYNNTDTYRFKLEKEIGYNGKRITDEIGVVTILETKKILTMYPIKLSAKYNNEKYLKLNKTDGEIK